MKIEAFNKFENITKIVSQRNKKKRNSYKEIIQFHLKSKFIILFYFILIRFGIFFKTLPRKYY
jgi:hypothetical protein